MKTNDFHHTSTLLSRISVWVRDALNYSETNQGEGGYQQLQSLLLEMNCSNSIHRLIQHSYRTPSHVQYFHSTLKSILSDQNPHLEEEEEGEGVIYLTIPTHMDNRIRIQPDLLDTIRIRININNTINIRTRLRFIKCRCRRRWLCRCKCNICR